MQFIIVLKLNFTTWQFQIRVGGMFFNVNGSVFSQNYEQKRPASACYDYVVETQEKEISTFTTSNLNITSPIDGDTPLAGNSC